METLHTEQGPAGWRVRIVADPEPYDTGDLFSPKGCPGVDPVDLDREEREFLRNLYDAGGPWAFIVERKCPTCGSWEQVNSCWGFDGDGPTGFVLDEGHKAMNYAAGQESTA